MLRERARKGEEKESVTVLVPLAPLERARGKVRMVRIGPVPSVLVLGKTNLAFDGLRREDATTERTVRSLTGILRVLLRRRRPKPRRLRPA